MKILFLDFDGVLASTDHSDMLFNDFCIRNNNVFKPNKNDGIYKDEFDVLFDPRCVGWLKTNCCKN